MRNLLRYESFERAVSLVLLVGMAGVIVLATGNFLSALWPQLSAMGPVLDYTAFQSLFDKALAAIIALELAHSVYQSVLGQHGLIQVRTVVIIGVLAVVRKFVLIDIDTVSGFVLIGLGVAILSLGVVYAVTFWIEWMRPDENARGGRHGGLGGTARRAENGDTGGRTRRNGEGAPAENPRRAGEEDTSVFLP